MTLTRRNLLLASALALTAAPSARADRVSLTASAASRNITPPTFVPYLTSSGKGSSAPFESVHDDLFARAIVLSAGDRTIAILAVDSLGYDNGILGPGRNFTAELRRLIADKTQIPAANIMFCATHTHSAPETIGLSPLRDDPRVAAWLEQHLQELAQTVIDAAAHPQPAVAFAATSELPGVARHRRIPLKSGKLNRRGPIPPESEINLPFYLTDENLFALQLRTVTDKPIATLINFTAHPVVAMVLPHVSADYCGAACRFVEEATDHAPCLFIQGCAGNINSAEVTTNYADVDRLGRLVADAALKQIAEAALKPPLKIDAVDCRSITVPLAGRDCPSIAELEAQLAAKPSIKTEQLLRLARKLAEGPIEAEIQAMRLGPLRWCSLPGEPFVEIGLHIKQAAGAAFVAGYSNGYIGYIPIRRAYDEGEYETLPGVWSRVAPGSAEKLEAEAVKLLSTLR